MSQLRPLRPEEVLRALKRAGFEKIRQREATCDSGIRMGVW